MKKIFIFLFCFFISSCFSYQYNLSICTIFRDEAPYLKEWIEYHRMLGVDHFYLCNHASKDDYENVLNPYIREGIVELKEWEEEEDPDQGMVFFILGHQNVFFNEILDKSRGNSKWVAFIDSDEFLVPVEKDSLIEFLKDYEEFSSVSANWFMFGSSGVSKINNNELMIEKLIKCNPVTHDLVNLTVKSIVQPEKAISFNNPHWVVSKENYYQVNVDKILFIGPHSPYVQGDKLRINHYWCRDEYYLENIKIPRRISFGTSADDVRKANNQFNQEFDLTIQRFVPELRKRMGLD